MTLIHFNTILPLHIAILYTGVEYYSGVNSCIARYTNYYKLNSIDLMIMQYYKVYTNVHNNNIIMECIHVSILLLIYMSCINIDNNLCFAEKGWNSYFAQNVAQSWLLK